MRLWLNFASNMPQAERTMKRSRLFVALSVFMNELAIYPIGKRCVLHDSNIGWSLYLQSCQYPCLSILQSQLFHPG